mmetsp:Transcript_34624/g.88845  ORF Transcript_34624/g.88845 Transcript_34624/m.88845 type:complete len:248 (-) Transcript_34624:191-934(-)
MASMHDETQAYVPMEGGPVWVKNAQKEIRMGFVRKVYSILAVQLLMTALIARFICQMPKVMIISHLWVLQASMFALLGVLCVMMCWPDVIRTYPGNYIFLFALTFCESVAVGFNAAMYDSGVVMLAVLLTAFIFLGMTAYAWLSKSDFTGYTPYLNGLLIALCAMGLGITLLQCFGLHLPLMTKLYAAGGIVLFTMYIVVDTQKIIGVMGEHKYEFSVDDYAGAALMLYLDIINIFMDLLYLLGDNR